MKTKRNFVVRKQGIPKIDSMYSLIEHDDIVFLVMDMDTKRHEIAGWDYEDDGTPVIEIFPEKGVVPETEVDMTFVSLPTYKDWNIAAIDCVRYTVKIILYKRGDIE